MYAIRIPATKFRILLSVVLMSLCEYAEAIVKYDEGRIEINGIQLLQDSDDDKAYYYLPLHPRVCTLANGDFEFVCIKYVGREGSGNNGGLFHALVEFSLTREETTALEKQLKEKIPGAVLIGPVPMFEDESNGQKGFRIVSTVLNDSLSGKFTSTLITSGKAPFLPGSKAAIAAHLSQDGATLLWESFRGHTSDVSVVVDGYFRALVKGYKATVQADLSLIYDHFSSYRNKQSGFSKEQATNVLDSLCQSGTIKIDVADLSAGLDNNTEAYKAILQLITDKIVDAMFDVRTGWAKLPATTAAAKLYDPKGRYQRGAFVRFFAGDGTQEYIPDDQLLLKHKKEIRNFHFFLDLNQSTVINVPVYAAGNLHGFYDSFKDDKRYFRVVDMDDPDFQLRDIHFQIDGRFVNSFGEILDQVSVQVEKEYPDGDSDSYTGSLLFNKSVIDSGNIIQTISYQRLGDRSDNWLKYKYKVGWKFVGVDSIISSGNTWMQSASHAVTLQPPLQKKEIEIAFNRNLLLEKGIQIIRIRFASILFGKPFKGKMLVIRVGDTGESAAMTVYHDKDQPVVYQVNWFSNSRETQGKLTELKDDFLFLVPPPIN